MVEAKNSKDYISQTPLQLGFYIIPPFYQATNDTFMVNVSTVKWKVCSSSGYQESFDFSTAVTTDCSSVWSLASWALSSWWGHRKCFLESSLLCLFLLEKFGLLAPENILNSPGLCQKPLIKLVSGFCLLQSKTLTNMAKG